MKAIFKALTGAASMLAAVAATAGIIFVPITEFTYDPTGPVGVQPNDIGGLAVTSTLRARLVSACGARGPAGSFIPLRQQLDLSVDPASGDVHGRSRAVLRLPDSGAALVHQAFVTGKAICLAVGGQACGQMTVDLKVEGALVRQVDGQVIGHLEIQQLATLVRGGSTAQWLAVAASGQVAGTPELGRQVLTSMEEDECGL